jgi:hypothetical protein
VVDYPGVLFPYRLGLLYREVQIFWAVHRWYRHQGTPSLSCLLVEGRCSLHRDRVREDDRLDRHLDDRLDRHLDDRLDRHLDDRLDHRELCVEHDSEGGGDSGPSIG